MTLRAQPAQLRALERAAELVGALCAVVPPRAPAPAVRERLLAAIAAADDPATRVHVGGCDAPSPG